MSHTLNSDTPDSELPASHDPNISIQKSTTSNVNPLWHLPSVMLNSRFFTSHPEPDYEKPQNNNLHTVIVKTFGCAVNMTSMRSTDTQNPKLAPENDPRVPSNSCQFHGTR